MGNAYTYNCRKIAASKLTADTGTSGPTYDSAIVSDAAQMIGVDEESGDELTLDGNGGVVATVATPGAKTWAMRHGGIQPELFAMVYDMNMVTEGSGSSLVITLYPKEAPSLPYFKLEGIGDNRNGGDQKLIVYKCKANPRTLPPVTLEAGSFVEIEMDGTFEWTASTIADAAHNTTATKLLIDTKYRATAGS